MLQENGGGGFQVLNLDDVFSEDKTDKEILEILVHLSRIFHDKRCFVNCENGYMHKLNDRGTKRSSSLHIFYKDPEEMGCQITLHLRFKPHRLIEEFITIQDGESGRLLTITFLDGESFEFDHHSWEQKGKYLGNDLVLGKQRDIS